MREELQLLWGNQKTPHSLGSKTKKLLEKRATPFSRGLIQMVLSGKADNDVIMNALIDQLAQMKRKQLHIANRKNMLLKKIEELNQQIALEATDDELILIKRIEYEALKKAENDTNTIH